MTAEFNRKINSEGGTVKDVASITAGLSIGFAIGAAYWYTVGGFSCEFARSAFAAAFIGGFSIAWHLVVRGLDRKGGE